MRKFEERSIKNLSGVHPDLAKVMNAAIKDAPVGFIIIYGVRTTEEQQRLYAQGRTAPGARVTNCDGIKVKSNHQVKSDGYGYAVDLYADSNNNGKLDTPEINDVESLKKVAAHVKETAKRLGIKIEWGGDWTIRDYPHFELKK